MKKLLIAISLAYAASLCAQSTPEAYIQTDLTSAYLWRGQKNAGVSLQPVVGVKWQGLHLYAWGNEQLSPPAGAPVKHEIDLFLKYAITPEFTVGFKNVYVNTRGDGVFSFGKIPHAANGLDAAASYSNQYFNIEWSTTIAGYDGYNHDGKRAYGSYVTVGAPFKFAGLDWNAQVGIVPYYCSRYSDDVSDGFHINMCALKASHTYSFANRTTTFTPYTQLMLNPSASKAYFQVGVQFKYDPAKGK